MKRRKLFTAAFAGLLLPACSSLAKGKSAAKTRSSRGLTPMQTAGPFYPSERLGDDDADLTFVNGSSSHADGEVVHIHGQVFDHEGNPLQGALVDIWQACKSGRYNHASDPNPAALDPHFQYWGRTTTDDAGAYQLKTIVPGAYPVNGEWTRPPHIHFKVSKRGYEEVTTQMYFKGKLLNKKDAILNALSDEEQDSVLVDFKIQKDKTQKGVFNIVLKKIAHQ